jgi:hypothetical protein
LSHLRRSDEFSTFSPDSPGSSPSVIEFSMTNSHETCPSRLASNGFLEVPALSSDAFGRRIGRDQLDNGVSWIFISELDQGPSFGFGLTGCQSSGPRQQRLHQIAE